MKLTTLAAAVCLASSATLVAQTPQPFTSPPGYLSTEGLGYQNASTLNGYSYLLGGYPDAHIQMVDGEINAGATVALLKSVGYRADYRSHSTSTAMGRAWSNVNLDVGPGSYTSFTTTFTGNMTSTPTRVFSGSVTWPSLVGNPATKPAAWDSAYSFPFGTGGQTSTYFHFNTNDLVLDWQFTGGVLANAATWGSSSRVSYYLDGLYVVTSVGFGTGHTLNVGTQTGVYCADSGVTSTTAWAYQAVQTNMYSKASTSAYAGKATLIFYGNNMAPSSPTVTAVSVLPPNLPGVQLPTSIFSCYNLMINLSAAFYFYGTTSTSGGLTGYPTIVMGDIATLDKMFPYATNPLNIYSQGVWNDSDKVHIGVSSLGKQTPNFGYGVNDTVPKKKVIYNYASTNPTGIGPYDYFYYTGLARYGQ